MKLGYICSIFISIISIFFAGCKKEWLDAKPSTALVVPKTAEDYQALLDNNDIFNVNEPALAFIAGDQFYISSGNWQSVPILTFKNAYTWADDIYQGEEGNSGWQGSFTKILYANVVLDGIDKVTTQNSTLQAINNIKGSALFFRAFEFYNLSQIFCKPYNTTTANTDLGLPLRLSSDINIPSVRSTLQETYDQIINDLQIAKDLLPVAPKIRSRPSVQAVDALLARIYLSMEDYNKAGKSADKVLGSYNSLIDYNQLNATSPLPFPSIQNNNKEIIFYAQMQGAVMFRSPRLIVDSLLYNLYESNDLRKSIFFTGTGTTKKFKGYYTGTTIHFSGLSTDEIYLIRAECYAREGNIVASMQQLNTLSVNRYDYFFVPFSASTTDQALTIILEERKKELLFRGLRWSDLRRLNRDNRFKETLTRIIKGQIYNLLPGDPKYIFLLPPEVLRLSDLQQNPR